jgi:hypothetical protein
MDYDSEITQLKQQVKTLNKTLKSMCLKVVELEKQLATTPTTSANTNRVREKSSAYESSGGTVTIKQESDDWIVTGKTFNLRSILKQHGGKWNGDHKHWSIPTDSVEYTQLANEISEKGLEVIGRDDIPTKSHSRSRPKPSKKQVRLNVTKLGRDETESHQRKYLMSDSDSD